MAKKIWWKASFLTIIIGFIFSGMGCASLFKMLSGGATLDQHFIKGTKLYKTSDAGKKDIRGDITVTNFLMVLEGNNPTVKLFLSKTSQNNTMQYSFLLDSLNTNLGYVNINSLLVKIDNKQPVTLVDNTPSKTAYTTAITPSTTGGLPTTQQYEGIVNRSSFSTNTNVFYKYEEIIELPLSAEMIKSLRSCKTLTFQIGNAGTPFSVPEEGLLQMKAFIDK